MWRVVSNIQHKGFIIFLFPIIYVFYGIISHGIRCIKLLGSIPKFIIDLSPISKGFISPNIVGKSVEMSEIFIKTPVQGIFYQVPFARHTSMIAGLLEHLWKGNCISKTTVSCLVAP